MTKEMSLSAAEAKTLEGLERLLLSMTPKERGKALRDLINEHGDEELKNQYVRKPT